MAASCDRLAALVSDDEATGCDFDEVIGDGFEVVDLEDSGDVDDESYEEAEVAARDASDGVQALGVGEAVEAKRLAHAFPVTFKNEGESVPAEGAVEAS